MFERWSDVRSPLGARPGDTPTPEIAADVTREAALHELLHQLDPGPRRLDPATATLLQARLELPPNT